MIWLFVIANLLLLLALWVPGLQLMARLDGWATLAERYRLCGSFPAERQRLIPGAINMRYTRSGLEVAVRDDGFYVQPAPIFRPGHPPIHLPWQAVRRVHRLQGYLPLLQFTIDTMPETVITLPEELFADTLRRLPRVESRQAYVPASPGLMLFNMATLALGMTWLWFALSSITR